MKRCRRHPMRRAICALMLAWAMSIGCADTAAQAQEHHPDLTELSLEELLELDVLSINVLGTHTHLEDEWMIGYKYMFMEMEGNRDGTDNLRASEVLQDFPITPTKMTMQMHMFEVMYAPSDDLTLMAMVPYIRLSMDHITRTGVRFTTDSEGIGDVKLMALYTFLGDVRRDQHRVLFTGGLSLPSGSIDREDDTPAGPNQKLPYPMQLGSGTVDLLPGIAYVGESENLAWAFEALGTIRLGENSNDYTLGNRLDLDAWGARKLTDWLSVFARIDGRIWGDIDGADPDLNPALVPTADPDRRGGERIDLSFGVNLYAPKGGLKGNRVGIQVGFPIYQSLDGPQLETDWHLTIGWNWTF